MNRKPSTSLCSHHSSLPEAEKPLTLPSLLQGREPILAGKAVYEALLGETAGAPKFEHQYNFCSIGTAGGLREVLETLACYSTNRTPGTLGTSSWGQGEDRTTLPSL